MTYAEAVARILALRGGERAGMRPRRSLINKNDPTRQAHNS
jgi:hypothetical protein